MVVLSEILQGSSITHDRFRYDVFLSFRGADTRNNFTDHLYNALKDANLETFLDDEEIETGLILKPELEKAIKSSRASIIVLSKNYASSTWCLEELVLILEQHKKFNQIVIPIFFHVEPTHVRKQKSTFEEAMEKHKQRMEEETNAENRSQMTHKIELWSKALTDVAALKGKDAKDRKETEFIEEIVTDIHHILHVPLSTTLPHLIGMDDNIESITSWLIDGSCHTTNILTILGMSGIGKTSLAKYVFGLHSHTFHKSSFLEGINKRCTEQFNGLLDLQKHLYGDICKKIPLQVHDVLGYTSKIENALARKKVFLVLDDIGSIDELNALLGNKGFHPESKIIMTTKDASLIEKSMFFNPQVHQVRLHGLYETNALELLSIHAFKCLEPKEGYEDVSKKLVNYCDGHPLALEVLGKSLCNRDVAYWESWIEGLSKEPESRIQKTLQMSYDSLASKNDKELFKHIACFFVGVDKDVSETILEACEINTKVGIKNLIDKCLLSMGCENDLRMHQLVQDMGRDVVRQESRDWPWKRSRLCCHEESFKVLKHNKNKDKENLLGLALDTRMIDKKKLHGSFELKTNSLSLMDNLLLLQLNYVQINGFFDNIPEELRWLCMHGFPLKSIPLHLPMENLVVLDMSYSKIESFGICYCNPQPRAKRQKMLGSCSKDKQLLGSLKILDLSSCEQLHCLCGFLQLPALERLIAKNCISLHEICESIEQCVELVFVDLSYCYKLKELPTALRKLNKVKTLLFDGFNSHKSRIENTDMESSDMGVDICTHSQTSSSAIIGTIPRDLKSFIVSLPCSLVKFSLKGNNLSNESFPNDLSSLSELKELYLDDNPIVSMPKCVRSLPKLKKLSMDGCKMLISIEHPPCTLRELLFSSFTGVHNTSVRKILFDPAMSPLFYEGDYASKLPRSSFQIDGMVKIEPLTGVEEKVLHSLGWKNLGFLTTRVQTFNGFRGIEQSQTQMYYEFGIFSTIYGVKEILNWMSDRREGPLPTNMLHLLKSHILDLSWDFHQHWPYFIKYGSKWPTISFTIPSSPNKLRGLNFCSVQKLDGSSDWRSYKLPIIKISNVTKSHIWIYNHYLSSCDRVSVGGKYLIYLSHWMFGMNEMESGDQVTVHVIQQISGQDDLVKMTTEFGVKLVYDDGKMEEEEKKEDDDDDVLSYYKSWNHIIGGDLSAFQSTSGEYILDFTEFRRYSNRISIDYLRLIDNGARYKEEEVLFKAFSLKKKCSLKLSS